MRVFTLDDAERYKRRKTAAIARHQRGVCVGCGGPLLHGVCAHEMPQGVTPPRGKHAWIPRRDCGVPRVAHVDGDCAACRVARIGEPG